MIKSFFYLLFISFVTFGVTCGGAFVMYIGGPFFGAVVVVLSVILFFILLRNFLRFYIWRYIGIGLIIGISMMVVAYLLTWILYSSGSNNQFLMSIIGIVSVILGIALLVLSIYIFHFYRIKAQNDSIKSGTFGGDIQLIYDRFFGPSVRFIFDLKSPDASPYITNLPHTVEEAPETLDLMSTLFAVDISNVESITFLPKGGTGFSIKTENIKRIAVYMTTQLGKTSFEGEELRKAFDYVVKNIESTISKRDFDLIQGRLDEFVKNGGEVKINQNNH